VHAGPILPEPSPQRLPRQSWRTSHIGWLEIRVTNPGNYKLDTRTPGDYLAPGGGTDDRWRAADSRTVEADSYLDRRDGPDAESGTEGTEGAESGDDPPLDPPRRGAV